MEILSQHSNFLNTYLDGAAESMLASILTKMGCCVYCGCSGQKALSQCSLSSNTLFISFWLRLSCNAKTPPSCFRNASVIRKEARWLECSYPACKWIHSYDRNTACISLTHVFSCVELFFSPDFFIYFFFVQGVKMFPIRKTLQWMYLCAALTHFRLGALFFESL